ncbi:helix-turn-helix transcriptional regulator [Bradyrhizobium canariense]|uniref:DNA-binding transcriptional regulator, CsgD family n=1 Tax=Bradyrhizobium canariense TaxID=255045 RepID=A0A1H1V8G4_9BRAD|nr:LuxR family transcriptional regulator [Bradyrhizobium canariense]SDS80953.1 DNA-binding transcriptional regulator, CsgD family [Bradyrhizobium canariense]
MHRIFQNFVEQLSSALDAEALREAMTEASTALDLSCFAYLSVPSQPSANVELISTYPSNWTKHYLRHHYELFDPIIIQAIGHPEPFEWGLGVGSSTPTEPQRELLEEAARFGIRYGFTVPIHDNRGPVAAMTFAADERRPQFERSIAEHSRVLQLMAIYFHAHARRKISHLRVINGVSLSAREFECLEWAAQGKSTWEIGRILGISRHTVATYLENVKTKLGVRTTVQAVARLMESKSTLR